MNIRKCCYICKHHYFYSYIIVLDICNYDRYNETEIKDVYNYKCKKFELKDEFKNNM